MRSHSFFTSLLRLLHPKTRLSVSFIIINISTDAYKCFYQRETKRLCVRPHSVSLDECARHSNKQKNAWCSVSRAKFRFVFRQKKTHIIATVMEHQAEKSATRHFQLQPNVEQTVFVQCMPSPCSLLARTSRTKSVHVNCTNA